MSATTSAVASGDEHVPTVAELHQRGLAIVLERNKKGEPTLYQVKPEGQAEVYAVMARNAAARKAIKAGRPHMVFTKVFGHLTAGSRDVLAAAAEPLGLRIYGYGDEDQAVVASRNLHRSPEPPAILQLTREYDNRARFEVAVRWTGPEPMLPADLLAAIETAVGGTP